MVNNSLIQPRGLSAFRFMRSVGVCVLLIIMDGPGEKRLASVKRYEGDPPEDAPKS